MPLEDVVAFVGRFHVLAVHLPIGVIVLAVGLEVVSTPKRWRGRFDPTLGAILFGALFSAIAAYLLGTALAREGGHPPGPLELHRSRALVLVATSALCCGAWWLHRRRGVTRWVHRGALAGLIASLTATAHAGGSLTHGERYLAQKAPRGLSRWMGQDDDVAAPRTAAPDAAASDITLFDTAIQPILVERCASCHGAELAKGGLRLDGLDAIVKGARSGPVLIAGRADASSLVLRIEKPLADDEHMPPADQPQPTAGEIALLRFWIERDGARALEVRDLLVPEDTRPLLVAAAARAASRPPPPVPAASSASPSASASAPAPAPSAPAVAPTPRAEPLPLGASFESAPEPAPVAAPPPPAARETPASSSVSTPSWSEVAPILASRCGPCHGAAKQKSGLRTDSLQALTRGGHGGPAVVLGDPRRGSLIERVKLDPSDPMHMPPAEEPQLTPGELHMLERWLARGPTAAKSASATPATAQPDSSGPPAASAAASAPSSAASAVAVPPAAPDAVGQPPNDDASQAASKAAAPVTASRPAASAPGGGCAACRIAPATSPSPALGAVALLAFVATGVGLGLRRRRRPRHTRDAATDERVDETRGHPRRSADDARESRPR